MQNKAQGALEYLLLIGGAVLVAGIVIVLLLGVSQSSGSTTTQTLAVAEVQKELAFAGINQSSLNGAWYLGGSPADVSNNGNNGTMEPGASFVQDAVRSTVLYLDGSNQSNDAGGVRLPSISPTNAITVSAWVKSTSNTYSSVWQFVSKYSNYILGSNGYNSPVACFIFVNNNPSTGWQYNNCYTVPDPQNWHMFIGTYDSSTGQQKLYVDGVLQNTTITSGTIAPGTGYITIGARECCAEPIFNGYISNVMIFNTALTAQQISALYSYQKK